MAPQRYKYEPAPSLVLLFAPMGIAFVVIGLWPLAAFIMTESSSDAFHQESAVSLILPLIFTVIGFSMLFWFRRAFLSRKSIVLADKTLTMPKSIWSRKNTTIDFGAISKIDMEYHDPGSEYLVIHHNGHQQKISSSNFNNRGIFNQFRTDLDHRLQGQ